MVHNSRRSQHWPLNIWPGFVDALAALLMVIMFVLMIFVVAQYYLGDALLSRNKDLDQFRNRLSFLSQKLELTHKKNIELSSRLKRNIQGQKSLRSQLTKSDEKLKFLSQELIAEQDLSKQSQEKIQSLSERLITFDEQVEQLTSALQISKDKVKGKNVEIDTLSGQLNKALANKVEEMIQYRSEFFGRLRKILGDHPDISIVGDRFIFQSEVLFDTASAKLEKKGIEQIDRLARTLSVITKKIPDEIDWILRVDGHTDHRPLKSGELKSNWELSFARAMAVVRQLMKDGISANRLAAAGFAENQPIQSGVDAEAYRKNRRIEIKLDRR